MKSKVCHLLVAISCAAVVTADTDEDSHSLMQKPPSQHLSGVKQDTLMELSIEEDLWPSQLKAKQAHAREMGRLALDDLAKQKGEEKLAQARLAAAGMMKKQEERAAGVENAAKEMIMKAKAGLEHGGHGRKAAYSEPKSSNQRPLESQMRAVQPPIESQMHAVDDFFKHAAPQTPARRSHPVREEASLLQLPPSPPREELISTDEDVTPKTTINVEAMLARAKQHGQEAEALHAKEIQRAKEAQQAKDMQQAIEAKKRAEEMHQQAEIQQGKAMQHAEEAQRVQATHAKMHHAAASHHRLHTPLHKAPRGVPKTETNLMELVHGSMDSVDNFFKQESPLQKKKNALLELQEDNAALRAEFGQMMQQPEELVSDPAPEDNAALRADDAAQDSDDDNTLDELSVGEDAQADAADGTASTIEIEQEASSEAGGSDAAADAPAEQDQDASAKQEAAEGAETGATVEQESVEGEVESGNQASSGDNTAPIIETEQGAAPAGEPDATDVASEVNVAPDSVVEDTVGVVAESESPSTPGNDAESGVSAEQQITSGDDEVDEGRTQAERDWADIQAEAAGDEVPSAPDAGVEQGVSAEPEAIVIEQAEDVTSPGDDTGLDAGLDISVDNEDSSGELAAGGDATAEAEAVQAEQERLEEILEVATQGTQEDDASLGVESEQEVSSGQDAEVADDIAADNNAAENQDSSVEQSDGGDVTAEVEAVQTEQITPEESSEVDTQGTQEDDAALRMETEQEVSSGQDAEVAEQAENVASPGDNTGLDAGLDIASENDAVENQDSSREQAATEDATAQVEAVQAEQETPSEESPEVDTQGTQEGDAALGMETEQEVSSGQDAEVAEQVEDVAAPGDVTGLDAGLDIAADNDAGEQAGGEDATTEVEAVQAEQETPSEESPEVDTQGTQEDDAELGVETEQEVLPGEGTEGAEQVENVVAPDVVAGQETPDRDSGAVEQATPIAAVGQEDSTENDAVGPDAAAKVEALSADNAAQDVQDVSSGDEDAATVENQDVPTEQAAAADTAGVVAEPEAAVRIARTEQTVTETEQFAVPTGDTLGVVAEPEGPSTIDNDAENGMPAAQQIAPTGAGAEMEEGVLVTTTTTIATTTTTRRPSAVWTVSGGVSTTSSNDDEWHRSAARNGRTFQEEDEMPGEENDLDEPLVEVERHLALAAQGLKLGSVSSEAENLLESVRSRAATGQAVTPSPWADIQARMERIRVRRPETRDRLRDISALLDATGPYLHPCRARQYGVALRAREIADVTGRRGEESDSRAEQGDMVASTPEQLRLFQEIEAGKYGSKHVAAGKPWTDGRVKYCFASDVPIEVRSHFTAATDQVMRSTCLAFEDVGWQFGDSNATSENQRCNEQPAIFVMSKADAGCYTVVGESEMPSQQLQLEHPACTMHGVILHELGHALGMAHENARPDRNNYIDVNFENVRLDSITDFDVTPEAYVDQPYQYTSLMHFDPYAFAEDEALPTIETKGGHDHEIGQRIGFTEADIAQIVDMYKGEVDTCASHVSNQSGCVDMPGDDGTDICSGLNICAGLAMERCCACDGGVEVQCFVGDECPSTPLLPHANVRSCIADVTAQYVDADDVVNGTDAPCIIHNMCNTAFKFKCQASPCTFQIDVDGYQTDSCHGTPMAQMCTNIEMCDIWDPLAVEDVEQRPVAGAGAIAGHMQAAGQPTMAQMLMYAGAGAFAVMIAGLGLQFLCAAPAAQ